jgi:type II secretory pathway pseudopilin PulG
MAASVQELILAAQAKQKKHPISMLADIVNSAYGGYAEGMKIADMRSETDLRRASIAKTLVEAQQAQAEMEQAQAQAAAQAEEQKRYAERRAIMEEQNLRAAQASVGGKPTATTPATKFTEKWSKDAKGNVTSTIEEVTTDANTKPQTPDAGSTDAQKAVDKKFAEDYNEYVVQGGYSSTEKNLFQLKDAYKKLTGQDYDTGAKVKGKVATASGPFAGMTPKVIADVVTPEGSAIQDQVLEAVQPNLRLILGPQFTAKEGEGILERSFNRRQTPEENARRVSRLINQIEKAARAKSEAGRYYEKHGTLKGFTGPSYEYDENTSGGSGSGESSAQRKARLLQELQGARS